MDAIATAGGGLALLLLALLLIALGIFALLMPYYVYRINENVQAIREQLEAGKVVSTARR